MNAKAVISFADCKIYLMGHSGQMPCFPYVSALCLQNLASISFNRKMAPLTWTHNSKVTLSPLSDQLIYVYQSFSTLNSFLHSQFTTFTHKFHQNAPLISHVLNRVQCPQPLSLYARLYTCVIISVVDISLIHHLQIP